MQTSIREPHPDRLWVYALGKPSGRRRFCADQPYHRAALALIVSTDAVEPRSPRASLARLQAVNLTSRFAQRHDVSVMR